MSYTEEDDKDSDYKQVRSDQESEDRESRGERQLQKASGAVSQGGNILLAQMGTGTDQGMKNQQTVE